MSETLTIASTLPVALRIMEAPPNPEKPGEAGVLKSAVINGAGNGGPGAEGVTRGVDADLYNGWTKTHAFHPAVLGGHLRVVDGEEADEPNHGAGYGFQPGLDALAEDAGNTDLAAKGSATTEPGPASATDMAATSDTPDDGSPRSQTKGAVPVAATPAAATPAAAKAEPTSGSIPFPDKK